MSKRYIYLLLAVSLGLNVGVVATTLVHRRAPEGPPPGPAGGPAPNARPDPERLVEDHMRGITRHLDLDTRQQQHIRAVLERHAPQLVTFQAEVEETGRLLSEVFAAPQFEAPRFRQLTAEASGARSRLDSLSTEMLVAEATVLTPEQRRKFADVANSVYSRPQGTHRKGGPPPR